MKKIIISVIVISSICVGTFLLHSKDSHLDQINNNANKKIKVSGSLTEMRSLNELKKFSDTIVEVEGTNEYKIIDYKGIVSRVSTVKVNEVFKGDKDLKDLSGYYEEVKSKLKD